MEHADATIGSQFTTDTNKGGLCYDSVPDRRLCRLPVPDRLSPGRARLHAASTAAASRRRQRRRRRQSPADGGRALRPCTVAVGRNRDGDGRRSGSGRRYAATTDGRRRPGSFANPADRQTRWTARSRRARSPSRVTVDDGKGGTATASTTIQVLPPPPVVELTLRRRVLRLRPLHAAAGGAAAARRRGREAGRRIRRATSSSRVTRATSARPNTTWRSASGVRKA